MPGGVAVVATFIARTLNLADRSCCATQMMGSLLAWPGSRSLWRTQDVRQGWSERGKHGGKGCIVDCAVKLQRYYIIPINIFLKNRYEIIVGLWFLGAAFFIFLGGVGRCLHTTRRSHATPPRRHLGWAPLEGPGRSYPEKRRCSAVLSAMPRRHFRLETVVFRRGGTDVPRANQRGRAALGRTQGPKPPTILAMGLLRPLQAPTAGADTAACPVWAVSGRHFRQNGREMEPILSAVWA